MFEGKVLPSVDGSRSLLLSRRSLSLMGLAAGALAVVGGAAARAAGLIAVSGVRLGGTDTATRLVLDLAASPTHGVFSLADPYRIVFDFPEFDWRVPAERMPAPTGLVRGLRAGLFRPGTFRL
ncbi:MAG: AMIN domain-containing protein, partial [Rhodospirillaceae bacterium]|nr:AMIN domain-containing protein [Rhodospirillaceae bacterium]